MALNKLILSYKRTNRPKIVKIILRKKMRREFDLPDQIRKICHKAIF